MYGGMIVCAGAMETKRKHHIFLVGIIARCEWADVDAEHQMLVLCENRTLNHITVSLVSNAWFLTVSLPKPGLTWEWSYY